ncbi:MAG: hypothetical protein PHV65_02955 [Bacteroidales bacterium]|nr:hypothetical protein [Bacteroidales bacterium]MDD4067814.1 hypothetical protein [Bacteroidales bacterium]
MESKNLSHRWSSIYKAGGITAFICAIIIITFIVINMTITLNGTDSVSQSATGLFGELKTNILLGLYNLGLLNLILQIALIPVFFAFYAAHRHSKVGGDSFLALVFFIISTSVFISQNPVLPFLELSSKYAAAINDSGRLAYEAAGEALLAKGGVGPGSSLPYILISFAGILISRAMFKGKVFNKFISALGLLGNLLLIVYFSGLVFFPVYPIYTFSIAAPALLFILVWITVSGVKLIKLTIHNK